MAPPNSYIHVEDFDTPHELAKYLDYLDRNETAYAEYHQWRAMEPDFTSPIRSGAGKKRFFYLKQVHIIWSISYNLYGPYYILIYRPYVLNISTYRISQIILDV